MPPKLEYEDVKNFFLQNNCILLSKQYINNNTNLTYIASCGHERISNFRNIKYNKYFKCKKCNENKYLNISLFERMHPKTFKKRVQLAKNLLERSKKYRNDFLPENYNRTLKCWDCKQEKNFKLFPYRKQYADNKEKRCKLCSNKNNQERRQNHTKEQFIQEMITCCKESALKRSKTRKDCGICTIHVKDVLDLYTQQKGICIFTGKELLFERNNNDKISIDRIDSNKGYTKENIQLVTQFSNQAKSYVSNEEYTLFIKNCYNHLFQNKNNNSHENYELNENKIHFIKKLLKISKSSANKRQKQHRKEASIHTIELEDILDLYTQQKGLCIYSGIQLQCINNKKNINNLSIDRIDSNKGYTKENIQLITCYTNQAKSNSTDFEFKKFIKDSYTYMFIHSI